MIHIDIQIIQAFSRAFVVKNFRNRFVHEAIKKPARLHQRICHGIEDVFPIAYKNCSIQFLPDEPCLILWSNLRLEKSTWSQVQQVGNGDGILVISLSQLKFYAETEGMPKSEIWGASLNHGTVKKI